MKVIKKPSPNWTESRYAKIGHQIHKTLGLMPGCLEWLTTPKSNVSANLLVTRDGTIYELVDLDKRAWAAGRINQPSERAKKIMFKNWWGGYVKPDYYLIQWEFECLENQTFTKKQYEAFAWYCKNKNLPVIDMFVLTHKDTAIDKPDLEEERAILLETYKVYDETQKGKKEKSKEEIKQQIIKLVKSL